MGILADLIAINK